MAAVEVLGWFPTESAPATPRLIMFLANSNDPEVRSNAETTLRAIGPSVVPELTAALSNSLGHVRQAGAEGLSWFPTEAASTVPLLIKLLRDDDSRVPLQAAKTLRAIGPSVASELAIALSNSDARIRQVAAEGLSWFPAAAESAIPLLIKSLADKVQSVRAQAADTLAIIAKDADAGGQATTLAVRSALRESLTVLNPFVRVSAARALVQIDPGDVTAINELRRCVVVEEQRKISEQQGNEQLERWSADRRAEEEYGMSCSLEAIDALAKIGPAALTALPELIAATRPRSDFGTAKFTQEEQTAMLALKTIGMIGPQADSAIPILMNLIAKGTPKLDDAAIEALVQIGPTAIPRIIDSLSDPAQEMRVAAIRVLGQFGPRAVAAIPELTRLKSDKNPVVVSMVQHALKKIEEK